MIYKLLKEHGFADVLSSCERILGWNKGAFDDAFELFSSEYIDDIHPMSNLFVMEECHERELYSDIVQAFEVVAIKELADEILARKLICKK